MVNHLKRQIDKIKYYGKNEDNIFGEKMQEYIRNTKVDYCLQNQKVSYKTRVYFTKWDS